MLHTPLLGTFSSSGLGPSLYVQGKAVNSVVHYLLHKVVMPEGQVLPQQQLLLM